MYMLKDIYKMIGFDDTVFDTLEKIDEAHTKLMELLDMCDRFRIIESIDEDMLYRIEDEEVKMKTIINRGECNPLSDNITGKLVVINPSFFKPKFRKAKYQIVLATGGFGCVASKTGNAVFVEEIHNDDPEHYRQERYNLIGEPTEEMIKKWKSMYGEFNEKVQKALMEEM